MKRALLIIGNGLSLDLRNWAKPQLEDWDPSNPLNWDLYTPGKPTVPWLDSLPYFKKEIFNLQQKEATLSNYEMFSKCLSITDKSLSHNNAFLMAEMQHFLAIAYSHFQLAVDRANISDWPWRKWFSSYNKNILGIVSFNYELVLETSLMKSKIDFRRFGLRDELLGIRILKPHGSIDFEIYDNVINCPSLEYPMNLALLRNNFPIKRLNSSELLNPRTEADIVLPSEYSTQLDYQWIEPGYRWFKENGAKITTCIIIGVSYWKCDRPEIDFLLKSLSPITRIIMANTKPSPILMDILRNKFKHIIEWRNGPEPL